MTSLGILLIIIGAVYGVGTFLFEDEEEMIVRGLIISFIFLTVGLFCFTNSCFNDHLSTFDQILP